MKLAGLFLFVALSLGVLETSAQKNMANSTRLKIAHISKDFSIGNLNDTAWTKGSETAVVNYWSGNTAPEGRHFKVRLLWSTTALYVRFDASQSEPLVISDKPDLTKKTRGLWDRDVCEIFIAPNASQRNKYFEFEIAPTGEWIDLGIEVTPKERITDWDYKSGMTSTAKIEKD